jgi:hypothetical protein
MTTKMRTKRKKRTRKKTNGSNLVPGRLLIAIAFLVTLLCPAALSQKKDKQKSASVPFALIAGTVYRPPGFALPGVEVIIAPEQPDVNGVKLKKAETVTNFRGEFAVRVPPVPARWRVDVKTNGYRPEQRSVSIEGEQRFDLSFVLEPVHPPKEAQ